MPHELIAEWDTWRSLPRAGAELLLGTDIRIASSHATFSWSEVRRGVIPFARSLVRLRRQVSYAGELLLPGRTIDADEALRIGLISRIVSPTD